MGHAPATLHRCARRNRHLNASRADGRPRRDTVNARLSNEELDAILRRTPRWWDAEDKLGVVTGHRQWGLVIDEGEFAEIVAEVKESREASRRKVRRDDPR